MREDQQEIGRCKSAFYEKCIMLNFDIESHGKAQVAKHQTTAEEALEAVTKRVKTDRVCSRRMDSDPFWVIKISVDHKRAINYSAHYYSISTM